jgi:hypothetical protein
MISKTSNGTALRVSLLAVLAGMVALGSGCAHQYMYMPIGPGASGGAAAQFPVPPAAPQGEVYVTSFGFTDFDNGQGGAQRLLHARVAVSNGSAATWEVDGRQQFLAMPGQAPQPPSFMNTNAGTGPVYPVAPGAANVFDLYFAPPPGLAGPESLGGWALDWSVNAGGQIVANQTSFERFDGAAPSYAPYPPYVVVGLGFGFGWWYSPFYPYRHYPPVIRGYYYAPRRAWGGPWRGPPPGSWRGAPPPRGGGGWRGAPPASGGWRGTPPATRSQPVPAPALRRGGGGFRGGGGRRH